MKVIDIVTDWLSETSLFEMAYQRKHVISKIRDLQDEIATHLVKHLYYDVPVGTKKHWEAEINVWLLKIYKLRLKNGKKLSGDMYYELLFKEPLGERTDVQGIIDAIDVIDVMDSYDKVMSVPELHERLEKILHTLSYDISNGIIKHIKYYLQGTLMDVLNHYDEDTIYHQLFTNFYKKHGRHDSMTSFLKEYAKGDNWGISGDVVKSKYSIII